MAYISKIQGTNGTIYDIKDAEAVKHVIAGSGITVSPDSASTAVTVGVKLSQQSGNTIQIKNDGLFVEQGAAPSYEIVKKDSVDPAHSGSCVAEYYLKKIDGEAESQVGATICIPKDQFLKEARFFKDAADAQAAGKTVPQGTVFPSLYFEWQLEGVDPAWVPVKDLVDVYNGSDYISIDSANTISIKNDENVEVVTAVTINSALTINSINVEATSDDAFVSAVTKGNLAVSAGTLDLNVTSSKNFVTGVTLGDFEFEGVEGDIAVSSSTQFVSAVTLAEGAAGDLDITPEGEIIMSAHTHTVTGIDLAANVAAHTASGTVKEYALSGDSASLTSGVSSAITTAEVPSAETLVFTIANFVNELEFTADTKELKSDDVNKVFDIAQQNVVFTASAVTLADATPAIAFSGTAKYIKAVAGKDTVMSNGKFTPSGNISNDGFAAPAEAVVSSGVATPNVALTGDIEVGAKAVVAKQDNIAITGTLASAPAIGKKNVKVLKANPQA